MSKWADDESDEDEPVRVPPPLISADIKSITPATANIATIRNDYPAIERNTSTALSRDQRSMRGPPMTQEYVSVSSSTSHNIQRQQNRQQPQESHSQSQYRSNITRNTRDENIKIDSGRSEPPHRLQHNARLQDGIGSETDGRVNRSRGTEFMQARLDKQQLVQQQQQQQQKSHQPVSTVVQTHCQIPVGTLAPYRSQLVPSLPYAPTTAAVDNDKWVRIKRSPAPVASVPLEHSVTVSPPTIYTATSDDSACTTAASTLAAAIVSAADSNKEIKAAVKTAAIVTAPMVMASPVGIAPTATVKYKPIAVVESVNNVNSNTNTSVVGTSSGLISVSVASRSISSNDDDTKHWARNVNNRNSSASNPTSNTFCRNGDVEAVRAKEARHEEARQRKPRTSGLLFCYNDKKQIVLVNDNDNNNNNIDSCDGNNRVYRNNHSRRETKSATMNPNSIISPSKHRISSRSSNRSNESEKLLVNNIASTQ